MVRGEGHTRLRERGWGGVPIRTMGQTLWYSRYKPYVLHGSNLGQHPRGLLASPVIINSAIPVKIRNNMTYNEPSKSIVPGYFIWNWPNSKVPYPSLLEEPALPFTLSTGDFSAGGSAVPVHPSHQPVTNIELVVHLPLLQPRLTGPAQHTNLVLLLLDNIFVTCLILP